MIWRKVWRDLTTNRSRLMLIVGSIGAALAGLGIVVGLSVVLRQEMMRSHIDSNPGHLNYWTSPFDKEVLDTLHRVDGVADVEAQMHVTVRWRPGPDEAWRTGTLIGRPDYHEQRMDLVFLQAGRWPRLRRRELAVEAQSIPYFNLTLGKPIEVDLGRRTQSVPLIGAVQMPFHFFAPAPMTGQAVFFATPKTVAWLTGIDQYNQINVQMETFDADEAVLVADRVRRRLEAAGIIVSSQEITRPDQHWLQGQMDAASVLLSALSLVSLAFSAFLIYNTISATVSQQTWQIGVMKVLGASRSVVARGYLTASLVYSMLGLAVAVPAAIVGYNVFGDHLMRTMMGSTTIETRVVPAALIAQAISAIAVSIVATVQPAVAATGISPHEAIISRGMGQNFGHSRLDRVTSIIRVLPRPLTLSLRNTFRRKIRLLLSVAALGLSGTIFIVVMSLSDSVTATLNASLATFGFDALLQLDHRYQASRTENITLRLRGVTTVEVWDRSQATVINKIERPILDLWGVPPDSTMFGPTILNGRRFAPEDGRVILINNKTADALNIAVGDELRLDIEGDEATWTVVGIVLGTGYRNDNFVPKRALARESNSINRGAILALGGQEIEMGHLMSTYRRYDIDPVGGWTIVELRDQFQAEFNLILGLLGIVAAMTAAVGSAVLGGNMLLNVIERRREIAVMRAIGASSLQITFLLIAEAVVIGLASGLVAVPLSWPITRSLCEVIGMAIYATPMIFRYSVDGVGMWMVVVIVLAVLTTTLAAQQAGRITVREALSYE